MGIDSINPSVTDIDELPLVRHLLTDWHWGEPFRQALRGPSGCNYFPEVQLEGLAAGDVDILAVNTGFPQEALAVSVKRIKVSASAFSTGSPNKLNELSKLCKQTNALVKLGFWQVCACVIVVVDSRENNFGNLGSLSGLTEDLALKIEHSIASYPLHESAGLLHVELVQSTECEPLTSGTISCNMRHIAKNCRQSQAVTDWVFRAISANTPNPSFNGTPDGAR